MRYAVTTEVGYVGDQHLPGDTASAICVAMHGSLAGADAELTVDEFRFAVNARTVLRITCTVAGNDPSQLTSPLQALTWFDNALDAALMATGTFEEFDVARKQLTVSPA